MMPAQTPFSNTLQGGDLLLLVFYILVGVYVLFTTILYYHWRTYSTDPRLNLITFITYFALTIPLIITLAAVVAI